MNSKIIKVLCQNIFQQEVVRFLLVGGFAAGINFFGRIIFRPYLSYSMSVVIGYLLGTLVSFILNKSLTFKAYNESSLIQLLKFLLITPLSILLGSLIASYSVRLLITIFGSKIPLNYTESLGHLIAIGATTIFNYFVIKYFCFRKIGINK